MEGRLIIFLACVAATLFVNTIILYLVFRIFGNLATKLTQEVHELQTDGSTRQLLVSLQSASVEAVKATGVVREQVLGLGPALDRMQAEHKERLAKVDVRFKLVCRAIHFAAASTEKVVNWPFRKVHVAAAVVNGIFDFIRGRESGSDARPTQTR